MTENPKEKLPMLAAMEMAIDESLKPKRDVKDSSDSDSDSSSSDSDSSSSDSSASSKEKGENKPISEMTRQPEHVSDGEETCKSTLSDATVSKKDESETVNGDTKTGAMPKTEKKKESSGKKGKPKTSTKKEAAGASDAVIKKPRKRRQLVTCGGKRKKQKTDAESKPKTTRRGKKVTPTIFRKDEHKAKLKVMNTAHITRISNMLCDVERNLDKTCTLMGNDKSMEEVHSTLSDYKKRLTSLREAIEKHSFNT